VRVELAPGYSISRIIKGGWQLAVGHSSMPPAPQAHADMAAFVDAGITTFDCADIYTGVEELIGSFMPRAGQMVQAHTKYVPDLATLDTVDLPAPLRPRPRSIPLVGLLGGPLCRNRAPPRAASS
jgi:aryl-alcohol dehydrogenase-like predicted oxidoreductase